MYPIERFLFHLKKKVKNLSKVEGSIVAQCINEETSNFAEYYFPSEVRTRNRRPPRHDDGGERAHYPVYVPNMFTEIGRVSGKGRNRNLTEVERAHLHTYILNNCEDVQEYERIYMSVIRGYYRNYTDEELQNVKEKDFAPWLHYYVTDGSQKGENFPTWLIEFVNGPKYIAKSYPRYCTRGYAFRILENGSRRTTSDYGISSQSGDTVYYGVLREILEVSYPGIINLRCIVFLCDWYDPFMGRGVRVDQFGVTSVHSTRRLLKYDPFILASQADQVCYIPYPRVTYRDDPWITVTPINPRGRIDGVAPQDPFQPSTSATMAPVEHSIDGVDLVVDFTQFGDATIHFESEEAIGEFDDDSDSIPSEYSSDSE